MLAQGGDGIFSLGEPLQIPLEIGGIVRVLDSLPDFVLADGFGDGFFRLGSGGRYGLFLFLFLCLNRLKLGYENSE